MQNVSRDTKNLKVAQKESENILDYCREKYNVTPIKIKVKNIGGGSAYYRTRFISIPIWAYNEGMNYFYAYVLHEIGHFINYDNQGNLGHSRDKRNSGL